MNIDERTKELFDKYTNLGYEWHDKYSNWVKNIVTICVGMLSVIVSLRQNKSDTQIEHILFTITIIGLTLGILSGVILLHRHIDLIDKHRKWTHQILGERMFDNDKTIKVEFLSPNKIYKISEYIFYVTLIVAILALALFAVIKDY